MKKFLFSVSVAAFFIACNSNPKTETPTTIVDTANRVQADKSQAMDMNGVNSDTIIGSDGQVYIKAKPNAPGQPTQAQSVAPAPVKNNVVRQPVRTIKHQSSGSTSGSSTSNGSGTSSNQGSSTGNGNAGSTVNNGNSSTGGSGTSTGSGSSGTGSTAGNGVGTSTGNSEGTTTTTEEPKKKGWSGAAKGAAIGGASGAVIGAMVSKNKGLGAVIGGVVGAGGGYLFGKNKDKKKQQADSIKKADQ